MIKMKCIVVLLAAVSLMMQGNVNAQIIFDTNNIANGEYSYTYYDGLYNKDETGKLDSEGNSVVTGQYRYVVGDKEYVVIYTADKDGYHPKFTIMDYERPPSYAFAAPPALVATLLG